MITSTPSDRQILATMRACTLFTGMNDEQYAQVIQDIEIKHKHPDQMVFQQGMLAEYFYYIFDGAVKIHRGTLKGDEKIIDVVFTGHTFAEGVMFNGVAEYPVSATILKPTTLVSIKSKPFIELLKNSTDLCINMLGQLSVRMHWMVREIDRLSLRNAPYRVVDYLVSQVAKEIDGEYILELNLPKRDIASRISIQPETLSRALKLLENKQLITVKEKQIVLNNVSELRALLKSEVL